MSNIDEVKPAEPIDTPPTKAVIVSVKKRRQSIKPEYDLDATGKAAQPSEATLAIVRRAAIDAEKHTEYARKLLVSPAMRQLIETMQKVPVAQQLAVPQISETLARIGTTQNLYINLWAADIAKLNTVKFAALEQLNNVHLQQMQLIN